MDKQGQFCNYCGHLVWKGEKVVWIDGIAYHGRCAYSKQVTTYQIKNLIGDEKRAIRLSYDQYRELDRLVTQPEQVTPEHNVRRFWWFVTSGLVIFQHQTPTITKLGKQVFEQATIMAEDGYHFPLTILV